MERLIRLGAILGVMAACAALTGCPPFPYRGVVYVDRDSDPLRRDGLTWTSAYHSIQQGIDTAQQKGIKEVWVAEGVYDEERNGNNAGALELADGITVYGGFAGTETEREDRDWQQHPTIIDGATARAGEAAYHVVFGANGSLDGFTIRNGQAVETDLNPSTAYGGGLLNAGTACTLVNCSFEGNTAVQGGAIFNTDDGKLTIQECTFSQNAAAEDGFGGAIFNSLGAIDLTSVSFIENTAESGGALFDSTAEAVINDCVFVRNEASYGGATFHSAGDVTIADSTFSQNTADGGGAIYIEAASGTVSGCEFRENEASQGGAMLNSNAKEMTISTCTFASNTAAALDDKQDEATPHPGGAVMNVFSTIDIVECTFEQNSGEAGGAVFNESTSGDIEGCIFDSNSADLAGGLFNQSGSSPTITGCTFTNNSSADSGGALVNYGPCTPRCEGCAFEGNTAGSFGGAIQNQAGAAPTITGCTILSNTANWGGGVSNFESGASLLNCLIATNAAPGGAAIYYDNATITITGCTIANNTDADSFSQALLSSNEALAVLTNCIVWNPDVRELPVAALDTAIVTYSDVRTGYAGEGNITDDPLFVNTAEGNYQLGAGSPCIDTGRDTSTTEFGSVTTDLTGAARGADGDSQGSGATGDGSDYDMGAYEYQP